MQMKDDNICRRCGVKDSKVVIPQNGELVCENCGLVYEERIIDETYEKRNFNNESSGGKKVESRISGPMRASDGGCLGTNMVISSRGGAKMKSASSLSVKTSTERGLEEIQKVLTQIQVEQAMIDETRNLFEQVSKKKKMKGRNLKCMIGAIYFIACRLKNLSKSFKEISKMMKLNEKKIIKAYKFIKDVVVNCSTPERLNEVVKNYISTFCESNSSLAKPEVKKLAWEIATKINDSSILEGRNTKTIAGLSVFLANKLLDGNLTKKIIAQNYTSEATLDNVFEKIKDNLEVIIPEKYHSQLDKLTTK